MKPTFLFTLLFYFYSFTSNAQVTVTSGFWDKIGDVNLSIVTTDGDNGDGVGDGAIFSDGLSVVVGQGASHTFGGTMTLGESITINTYTYNDNVSYVRFNIDLYNVTDGTVLAVTPSSILISNSSSPPVLTTLNYTALASDVGDVLQVRYIRDDPGDTYRNLVIDNLYLGSVSPANNVPLNFSQTCPFTLTPDLALLPSSPAIEAEIDLAISRFSDSYLGTSAPSAGQLSSAESTYDALNITVNAGVISGNTITSFTEASFLRTFAQHLKFNPTDTAIQTKANNAVWWVSLQFCTGVLPRDLQKYSYEDFARPTSLLKDFLDPGVKDLFAYTFYVHTGDFEHYWEPTYDAAYQAANGTVDTDLIYNLSDALMAYVAWQDTDQERYRYMRGYTRYLERFFSYTEGTTDGIKKDGSGFHHWNAYTNYMYAYKTASNLLEYLSDTDFQVDQTSYKVFRNAVCNQFMLANDDNVQALSTAGRKPEVRTNQFNQSSLKKLAIEGGKILGLTTADPEIAGMYNRIYGVDPAFNYSTVAPFTEGFFQFNHASGGVFRKNNWVAFTKGFSNNMWGAEIYTTANRYGRYQSYGALEVIYPGDKVSGNGYDVTTWDWNYNPGTTVIKLPWDKLHAERGRIDELQQNRFVGSLSLNSTNSQLLTNNHGDYGLFAMDFQEQEGLGWGTTHSTNNHNNTFTFKKSNFFFDDLIVCLGSGITNDDTTNPTITTLYQRLDNSGSAVTVNGTSQSSIGEVIFSGASNNWLLSNYDTGVYLLSGSNSLKVKKEVQQNPNHNQIWPVDFSGNPTATYYTGYIDHGVNPSNKSYEYILKPDASIAEMQALDTDIQGANKPYAVHQQDANAHIVEHISKNIWGYSFFNSVANLTYDFVTDVDASCLVMTEYDSTTQTLLVSLSNPDIGFDSRSYAASLTVVKQLTLQGEWHFVTTTPDVTIVSANATETIIDFTTVDGLSYEVLLEQGPETCATTTTFSLGSWDNGVPNTTKKAVFTEDYDTSNGDIDACTCEVRPGATVTVVAGDYVKINGSIAINGTLLIENEGSLVQVEDGASATNNGTITVEKITPTLAARDFMVIGSPMSAETQAGVYGAGYNIRNHVTGNFVPHPDVASMFPLAENFSDDNGNNWLTYTGGINPGEGYLVFPQPDVSSSGSYTHNYTQGTLNNGVVAFDVLFNTTQNDSPNVLSNPYASAIDADLFFAETANAAIDVLYFWEHLTAASPTYPGYFGANYDMGDISLYSESMGGLAAANGGVTPNDIIASGQGFGIKAASAITATFNNAMRITGPNDTYRNTTVTERDRVWINVFNDTYELGSTTLIGFSENTSDEFNNSEDVKRLATPVSLYSELDTGEQLAINALGSFEADEAITLSFVTQVKELQEYRISIQDIDGLNLTNESVYLIDNQAGSVTNLSEGDYSFQSDEGTQSKRFTIVFENSLLGINDSILETIAIYPNPTQNMLSIASPRTAVTAATVYDISGRIVIEQRFSNQGNYQLDLSELNVAMYFVEIVTENGSITKQIIKR